MRRFWVLLLLFGLAGCVEVDRSGEPPAPSSAAVAEVLDDWHAAASVADGDRYFGHFAADGVFLGTDASERWTLDEFREYAQPYFSEGRGWTYDAHDRHVAFSGDGGLAWVDEKLANEKYGELRGTGVLRLEAGEWKLVHYSMSFPVPNEITVDVVSLIRGESEQPD